MTKYRTITGVFGYSYGIYDRGVAKIETNGRRFRIQWDAVRWVGNTGGAHTYTEYLDIAAGRKRLRAIRKAQIAKLKGEWLGYDVIDAITGQ